MHWYFQIPGRRISLFIYTTERITSNVELRYSYNLKDSKSQSWFRQLKEAEKTGAKSTLYFCDYPQIVSFLDGVRFAEVAPLTRESTHACIELMLLRAPGRALFLPFTDCESILNMEDIFDTPCNFAWLFAVCIWSRHNFLNNTSDTTTFLLCFNP